MRPPSLAYSVERRVPASCLLITPAVELANSVYGTLERELVSRVWVWHEPAAEPAVRVLGVCRFRLILLDMATTNVLPGSVLRALKEAAPETPLVLLAVGAATALGIERAGLGAAARVPRTMRARWDQESVPQNQESLREGARLRGKLAELVDGWAPRSRGSLT